MFYRRALRPILFRQDPEKAHERTIEMLATLDGFSGAPHPFTHPKLQQELAGLEFPNPVGLAAGCDKNARAVMVWPRFGFGFVEVGTITAQPQPGNPRPRLFRVPEYDALVNRLGFNSEGSEVVAKRLSHLRQRARALSVPLAVNIGKTKLVTGDDAVLEDYRTGFRRLAPYADLIVVNVSSPNTPGLRQWQQKEKLTPLLAMLMEEASALSERSGKRLPLFVKISPDMADADMFDVAEVAQSLGLAGIIATNTTIAREGRVAGVTHEGGLSGKPLRERATEVIRLLFRHTEGRLPLIGVGGIFTAEDAYARIRAGASLVQLYSGMIYEGPYLARRINTGLIRLMERDGVQHLAEIIGVDADGKSGAAH
ncbi:MAG TPA: quinone-dependent dihydroorotate dehydrogenase [Chthonomonadaceae bacterium]|nr:quinone-dependent dihydroorotate dehydrogenase [Chthonomonadaceae bacterium]